MNSGRAGGNNSPTEPVPATSPSENRGGYFSFSSDGITRPRRVTLRKDGIEQMEVSRRSLMPEGVTNVLARDEIRDLLAYLQTLR